MKEFRSIPVRPRSRSLRCPGVLVMCSIEEARKLCSTGLGYLDWSIFNKGAVLWWLGKPFEGYFEYPGYLTKEEYMADEKNRIAELREERLRNQPPRPNAEAQDLIGSLIDSVKWSVPPFNTHGRNILESVSRHLGGWRHSTGWVEHWVDQEHIKYGEKSSISEDPRYGS